LPALEDDGGGIDEVDDDGGDSTELATSKTESATSSTEAGTNSTESATSRTESATSSTESATTPTSAATGRDLLGDEHVLGERLIRVCEHRRRAVIELPAGIHGDAWPSEDGARPGCAWRRSAREARDQCARERNEESRPTRDINATACMREWNRMDRGNRVKPVSHAARMSTFEKTHM